MPPKKEQSYYAVRQGRVPGVYRTYPECWKQVNGFKNAIYKKFTNSLEASAFMAGTLASSLGAPPSNGSLVAGAVAASSLSVPPSNGLSAPGKIVPIKGGIFDARCKCGKSQHTIREVESDSGNKGRLYVRCNDCNWHNWLDKGSTYTPLSSQDSRAPNTPGAALALRIYVDGACHNNTNVRVNARPAGWGVAIYRHSDDSLLHDLFGPVELEADSVYYMNAEMGSNNTAELTAFGESLLWIREFGTPEAFPGGIKILYDSEYAYKSITGEFNGDKNVPLIRFCRDIYKICVAKRGIRSPHPLTFEKVKGHSGDVGNERADYLAGLGAKGQRCNIGRYSTGFNSKNISGVKRGPEIRMSGALASTNSSSSPYSEAAAAAAAVAATASAKASEAEAALATARTATYSAGLEANMRFIAVATEAINAANEYNNRLVTGALHPSAVAAVAEAAAKATAAAQCLKEILPVAISKPLPLASGSGGSTCGGALASSSSSAASAAEGVRSKRPKLASDVVVDLTIDS